MLIKNDIHLKKVINESIKFILKEEQQTLKNHKINADLAKKIKNIDSGSNKENQINTIKTNNIILSFILHLFDSDLFNTDFYKNIEVNEETQKRAKEIDEKKIGKMLSDWVKNLKAVKDIIGFNKVNNELKKTLNNMFICWEPLLIISLNIDKFIDFIKDIINQIKYEKTQINGFSIDMPTANSIIDIIESENFKNFLIENKLEKEQKIEIYNTNMQDESDNFLNNKWSSDSSISWIKSMLTGAATFLFGEEDAQFVNDIFDGIDQLASSGIEKNINLVKQLEKDGGIKNVLDKFMKGGTPGKEAIEKILNASQELINKNGSDNDEDESILS